VRALITGGAGFIGSHLSEALLNRGDQVLILDNLSTGSIDNVAHLIGRTGFAHFIDSVENESLLAELIERSDMVFHLAAAVGVKLIVERPVHTIETNVHGTEIVLKHANKKKQLVVVASTSEVYGKSDDVPFREDSDLVLGPTVKHRWAYACSKAIDEFLALAYWRERQLPIIIVRFFNTVGPRQTGKYGMVIPTFVQQALAGEAITVFGDGTQSRSFTHVADVVGAVIKLVNEPRAIGQVVNIGSTQETTIGALAGRIRELSGSESTIKFIPYDEAYELGFEDMPRRIPDLSRIKSLIGYEPIHSLDDVLCDVIGHFRRADPARILGCAKQTHEIAELRSDHLAGGGIDCVR
jgi:UDP-glucose 4-epimerase